MLDRMHLTEGTGKIQEYILSNAILKMMNNITTNQYLTNQSKPPENMSETVTAM